MSVNRENVVWQSVDGTWNRGFYRTYEINTDSDDYDYEWDVEYDYSAFEWVATGLRDEDAALASWRGANPGGYSLIRYDSSVSDNADYCMRYDRMARELKERVR